MLDRSGLWLKPTLAPETEIPVRGGTDRPTGDGFGFKLPGSGFELPAPSPAKGELDQTLRVDERVRRIVELNISGGRRRAKK